MFTKSNRSNPYYSLLKTFGLYILFTILFGLIRNEVILIAIPQELKSIVRVSSDLSTAITAIIGSSIVCIVFIVSWFTLKFFTIDLDLALFLKSINLIIQTLIFNEIFKLELVPLLLMKEIKQIFYSASINDNLQQATFINYR